MIYSKLFCLILFCIARSIGAADGDLKPKVVFVEHDPWAMVVGSDSPSFVIYEDGLVIFRNSNPKGPAYLQENFSKRELKAFLRLLPAESDWANLKDHYELADGTDQPDNVLSVWEGGRMKRIQIYGAIRRNMELLEGLPKPLQNVMKKIINFDVKRARLWVPGKIELMIWPYEYAPEKSLNWPEGWPDLKSPETKKRGENGYSLFIDMGRAKELDGLLGQLKEKQALLINAKKWAVSYRMPFPGESAWMGK